MSHIYIEVFKESRPIKVGFNTMEQTFTLRFCLDPTAEQPSSLLQVFGDGEDIIALRYAYQIFPVARILVDHSDQGVILVLSSLDLKQVGRFQWEAIGKYQYNSETGQGRREGDEIPENAPALPFIRYNLSIGGGTKHITRGLEELEVEAADWLDLPIGAFPSHEGLIGWTPDGLEGLNIPDASCRLGITVFYFPNAFTLNFVRTIQKTIAGSHNTGSMNDATFLGFESGELSLLTATGGAQVYEIVPVTYEFSFAANVTNETDIGFPNLTMLGHDHVQYDYEHQFNADDAKKELVIPIARRVIRVKSLEDYGVLNIPGAVND